MNRRFAIALVTLSSLAILAALALSSRAAHPHHADAPDPLAASALRPPPSSPPPRSLCISGPGTAASSLPASDLPSLSRRAFAAERLAERTSTTPAFPQRMGLAVSSPPPPTCIPTP